jgi:hypothetical protein
MQILVDINGVIRGQNDEPIGTGIVMVGTLSVYNKLILMSSDTLDATKSWLDVNKVVEFDEIIDSKVHLEGEKLSERQLRHARSRGPIDLFITNDPSMWAFAFDQGIPSVMFGVPSYTRVEFRPDAPKRVRTWSEIEDAVERQNALRTNDKRLSRNEGVNFE